MVASSTPWRPSARSILIASVLWLAGTLVALLLGPVASGNSSIILAAAVIVLAATAIVAFLLFVVCADPTDDAEPGERRHLE